MDAVFKKQLPGFMQDPCHTFSARLEIFYFPFRERESRKPVRKKRSARHRPTANIAARQIGCQGSEIYAVQSAGKSEKTHGKSFRLSWHSTLPLIPDAWNTFGGKVKNLQRIFSSFVSKYAILYSAISNLGNTRIKPAVISGAAKQSMRPHGLPRHAARAMMQSGVACAFGLLCIPNYRLLNEKGHYTHFLNLKRRSLGTRVAIRASWKLRRGL
jgi:hypothetical protein